MGKVGLITGITGQDGTFQKLLSSSKLNSLGWIPKYTLEDGIKLTIDDFILNQDYYCGK